MRIVKQRRLFRKSGLSRLSGSFIFRLLFWLNFYNYLVSIIKLNDKDVETLIDSFNNTNLTRERGIYFDETNFTCLRTDENSIYGKEVHSLISHLYFKIYYKCNSFERELKD